MLKQDGNLCDSWHFYDVMLARKLECMTVSIPMS